MKYKDWLKEWLENYVAPAVKARTYNQYVEISKNRIIPYFGECEIEDVTPLIVQRYITELMKNGNLKSGEGLSSNSINSIITVIQSSMERAYVMGVIPEYTMNRLKRPRMQERKIECFTTTEQKIIEQAVQRDKHNKMKGVILCLYTGLRIGELLALEWEDIDLNRGEITVNKTCHDGKNEKGEYCRLVDTPKTATSHRVVPLPKQLIPFLKEWKKARQTTYVVEAHGRAISVRSYQSSFSIMLKNNKIPHRGFHALRHTFATRALECGMDVKSLSEILGHKSPTVTLKRYAHSMMDHKKMLMNRLGKLF